MEVRISLRITAISRILAAAAVSALLGGCSVETLMDSLSPPQQASVVPPPDLQAPDLQAPDAPDDARPAGPHAGKINASIGRYSAQYRVPESLVRRIIVRESGYNASARHGPFMGLMQIRYDTARALGYEGSSEGLLDPDINLRYGVKYLAGAYKVAYGDPEKAISYYATGYYYDARKLGMVDEIGLKRGK